MPRRAILSLVLLMAAGCGSHPTRWGDAGPRSDAGGDGGTDAGGGDAGSDAGPMCPFVFHNVQGWPCNVDSDCTTGRCYFPLDLTNFQPVPGYCTTECEAANPACPSGYTCMAAADRNDTVCALNAGQMTLPGDGTLPFGSPCDQDSDCAGTTAFCGFIAGQDGTEYTYCSSACDGNQAGSCGKCGTCVAPQGGGSDECQPSGNGAIGVPCQTRADCASFQCEGFCTAQCVGGGQVVNCPSGTICEPVTGPGGEMLGWCIDPSQIGGTATGQPCAFDFQCASGDQCHVAAGSSEGTCETGSSLGASCAQDSDCGNGLACRDIAPGTRPASGSPEPDTNGCTKACGTGGSCGSGNACVVVDIDTDLQLFNASSASALIATDDDINPPFGDRWSALTESLPAGSYWVEVTAYNQSQGDYVLEISDGVHAEGIVAEVEPNDSFDEAQSIDVPVKVEGSFSGPGDADFYTFTLTSPATLTIQTEPGAPSLCLPATQVGQVAWGSACTTDWQCASDLCEQALQVCGKPCTQNTDCGGVNPPPDAGPSDGGTADGGSGDGGMADSGDSGDGGSTGSDGGASDAGPLPVCADFLTHYSCVMPDMYGQLMAGSGCDYSFQCADGYCADFCGAIFCTEPCSGAGASCGIVVNGMGQNECAPMTTSPGGVPVSDYACVPTDTQQCASGMACAANSDCVSGQCDGGACQ